MAAAIIEKIKGFEPEPIAIREDIHRRPETAFRRARPAKLVADARHSRRSRLATHCKTLALAALLSIAALPARATSVDMATFTCQDWIDASDDEQDQMIAWLRGYLAGRSSATLYDADKTRFDRDTLMVACRRNPTMGVISAMSQAAR